MADAGACVGPCHHDAACTAGTRTVPCPGRLIHLDRRTALSSLAAWEDTYICDTCRTPVGDSAR